MADQVQNLCFLKMPLLVIKRILSNIHNPSNVSRTCKLLYEIVCDMEKHRRVMFIRDLGTTTESTRLTINDDAVFASIMNTYRTIDEIKLDVQWREGKPVELNERQLERMTAIMKQFAANITNFKLRGITLSINAILEWLHQAPKLESLTLFSGSFVGMCPDKESLCLQLSSLKSLETSCFNGLSDIVNLIPPGSLNHYYYYHKESTSRENFKIILAKQQNLKSLHYHDSSLDPDLTVLRVNHLQLERLQLNWNRDYNDAEFVEILKCHINLKELILPQGHKIGSAFKWICKNLKNLEVFEVTLPESQESHHFKMLGELKKLRHFRTEDYSQLLGNGFQFKSDSLEKLELNGNMSPWHGEPLHNLGRAIVQCFTNLTYLEIHLVDFAALTVVLSHCATLTHLTGSVIDTNADKLTQQRFPNMKHLTLTTNCSMYLEQPRNEISPSVSLIVQAMPNLKNLDLALCRSLNDDVVLDVNLLKDVIKESKHLEHLHLQCFELHPDDIIEGIRCLLDQLECYVIQFFSKELKWRTMKDHLSDEFYFRNVEKDEGDEGEEGADDDDGNYFYVYKGECELLSYYKDF